MEIYMTESFEEYLEYIEKHGDSFPRLKNKNKNNQFFLGGKNGNSIVLKDDISLNYGTSASDVSIIYIEDISKNKQFTNDLRTKKFKLHLSDNVLYIDFDTDYYYTLHEFETFEQFEYCQKNKILTIALLNEDKSNIINKLSTDVNLL